MAQETVPLTSLAVGGVINIWSHCCALLHDSVLTKATFPTANDQVRHRQEAIFLLG